MSQANPFLSIDQLILGDVYTSTETMDNLLILCDEFGSRFGGTEGERQAAEFAAAKMEEYGLRNVHLEPVSYIGWTRGEAQLEIVSPVRKVLAPCISLPLSPPGDLHGELIDMGDGAPADFDERADEIAGKVVMVTSEVHPKSEKRWIHRKEKYDRSTMAGATGFIFVNHYPGYGPATGGVGHDGEGLIPAVGIGKEEGAYLQRLLQRGDPVTVHLLTTDASQPMTSWNVVGDLPGTNHPQQVVMLGCHYDGHDISQGAVDPVSGVVAVLEAARVLAAHAPELRCTVRFVLWGVEEIGLLGSRDYVQVHAGELSDIRFYLNMDSAGSKADRRDIVLNEWPTLASLFERWSHEMALEFAVEQSVSAFSDHFPFFMAGVPTGGIKTSGGASDGRGYGHTRYDTVDKVDPNSLRATSELAARLALRAANEEAWPVERREGSAVLALLDGPEYREEQAYRERVEAFYREARGEGR